MPRGEYPHKSYYPLEMRQHAALLFLITGRPADVARQLNIPRTTVSAWVGSEGWSDLIKQARVQHAAEVEAGIRGTLNKVFGQLHDRIENGDYKGFVVRNGDVSSVEVHRIPVSAWELARIANTAVDRLQRFQLGRSERIAAGALSKIAEFLAQQSARGRTINGESSVQSKDGCEQARVTGVMSNSDALPQSTTSTTTHDFRAPLSPMYTDKERAKGREKQRKYRERKRQESQTAQGEGGGEKQNASANVHGPSTNSAIPLSDSGVN